MNDSINFISQGKGGIGKSYVSQILSQYFMHYRLVETGVCDTDPVNASTARMKALQATFIEIMQNDTILQSRFDSLFEAIINNENTTFVIDNGASTFIPMMKYFKDNDVINLFDEIGRPTFIHSIITGGQAQMDTIQGFIRTCELVKGSNVKVIAWINEKDGIPTVETKSKDTRPLYGSAWFERYSDNLAGIVNIVDRQSDAFTNDLKLLTENNLTLEEAKQSSIFNIMQRTRLNKVFKDIYGQLDSIYDAQQQG
ncbi:conjugal transfer protein TraL [Pectobacterium atrosepticum]|nr:conjugal transfer protein TraL [Pectobacterium atrosepticum]KFX10728.1 conjugal transfer protein TraL [Pectobacterium atrosepticum]